MDVDQQLLVEQIRNQKRYELKLDQKSHRKKELDRNRAGLGELDHSAGTIENISEQEVKGLAGRIKRRKRCEQLDLVRLSCGFQQSRENISHFIRITGAINVIVKELTGNDYNLQLLAAECLCNLSLGDDVCCEKLATFSGTYLIAHSANSNFRLLQQTCLWTLQNIVGSSPKGTNVLFSQGLVDVLIRLLSTTADPEAADDINLTLELALNYRQENEATLTRIIKCFVGKVLHPTSLRLLHVCYSLTTSDRFDRDSSVDIIHSCLNYLSSVTGTHLQPHTESILLSVRILARHISSGADSAMYAKEILCYLVQNQPSALKFSVLFNGCAAEQMLPVSQELLWFLAKLHTEGACCEELRLYHSFDNVVEKLTVPRLLL